MKAAWIAACCLFIAGPGVQGGTRDPSTPDQKHLDYGAQFHSVARISCRKAGKPQMASCVIIGPRTILTAAHVVEGTDGWIVDEKYPLAEVLCHPDYDEDVLGTRDVAVGRLSQEILLDFYPPIYAGSDETGKIVSIAGYGTTGTFAAGVNFSDGKRRGGSNTVDGVIRGMLVCSVSGGRRTSLEFLIAPGDSGGGMFLGNELCGIHSLVMCPPGRPPMSRYGDESGHTRLSEVRDWILQEMAKHAAIRDVAD
jgi:hypothetical protein